MDKQSKQEQPHAPVTPPKQARSEGDGWTGNAPSKPDGTRKHAFHKAIPAYSLDALFLIDPNFESCW